MLWLVAQPAVCWCVGDALAATFSMLVDGRTIHARECQGMLVGAGDLLRQIVATKGIKMEQEERDQEEVPETFYQKKERNRQTNMNIYMEAERAGGQLRQMVASLKALILLCRRLLSAKTQNSSNLMYKAQSIRVRCLWFFETFGRNSNRQGGTLGGTHARRSVFPQHQTRPRILFTYWSTYCQQITYFSRFLSLRKFTDLDWSLLMLDSTHQDETSLLIYVTDGRTTALWLSCNGEVVIIIFHF